MTPPEAVNADPIDHEGEGRRVATVDVGTNSIRLLVAVAYPDGTYRLLDDEKVVVRLGRGMARSGKLEESAMHEAVQVLTRMKAIAQGYDVELLRAVATCAVRESANRGVFLEMVREKADIELEVIDGEEEARFAFLSVRNAFDISERDVAVVDIGGGSTEILLSAGGMVGQIVSLPLGAVRLTEAFAKNGEIATDQLRKMRKRIRRSLRDALEHRAVTPDLMIGTGGTFTTLAAMRSLANAKAPGSADPGAAGIRGYSVQRAEVRRTMEQLAAQTAAQRAAVPGLSPDRADIIVAGLAIADTVMKTLEINELQVHDRGIRDGLLLSMTRDLFPDSAPPPAAPPDRLRAVRRFARKCRYEKQHSEHVTRLALSIYDQLDALLCNSPEAFTRPEHRELLEAAGVLHDIGYYIDYSKHHKHSYHLIVHSDLVGFSHREIELIANVARYHRRAVPKSKHNEFRRLSLLDQRLVRQLSAILRIADGLDRAHSGNVRRVEIELNGKTAFFIADATEEPDVDLWGAARKSELFRKTFGLEARFHWSGRTDDGRQTPAQANSENSWTASNSTDAGDGRITEPAHAASPAHGEASDRDDA